MSSFDGENGQHDCQDAVAERFSDRALIIASNCGPITFDETAGDNPQFRRGAGGLVTALTGLAQHLDTMWIACARTKTDAVWREGLAALPGSERQLCVKFLAPEPAIYERYYDVIANPLLWFLQHAMWDVSRAPVIDRVTWEAWDEGYKVVNCLFAEAIVQRIRADPRPTLIMLQDYHLYLVARVWSPSVR
jgi:trehalose 6-phosphate synthase